MFSDRFIFKKTVQFNRNTQFGEGTTLNTGATTGLKIGGATTQKLGFFGVTPVVQYAGHLNSPAAGTYGANEQGMLNFLRQGLGSYGFFDIT